MNTTRAIFLFVFFLSHLPGLGQTNPPANLSQFLFPAFTRSNVLLKNGTIWSADFNYQIVDEEMVFSDNGKYMVPEKPLEIDTLYIHNRPFIPVERAFYEVILNSNISFYVQYKGKYTSVGTATAYGLTSQTNAPTIANTMRSGNQVRNLDMPDNVTVTPSTIYWVKIKGELLKFSTKKQFLRLFPDKEPELEQFIRKNKIDFKNTAMVASLGKFCNELY